MDRLKFGAVIVLGAGLACSKIDATDRPDGQALDASSVIADGQTTSDGTSDGKSDGKSDGTPTTDVRLTDGGTPDARPDVTIPTGAVIINPGDDVQAALNGKPAGSAYFFKPGIHRLSSPLSPKAGDLFVGDNGAIVSGSRLLTSFTRSGNAWFVSGQTQGSGTPKGTVEDGICRSGAPRCGYAEDLFIDDVPLRHAASFDAGTRGWWYFDYAADRIYIWDDPAGKIVDTSVVPWAIGGAVTGVTIRNLIIEKFAVPTQDTGAVSISKGWIIEDSEVRLNHYVGIETGPDSITRRNNVHHNGGFGFEGAGGNILVEGNEISYNNFAGYNPYWGAGGSKWVFTDKLIVRGNFSHHNRGPGLWTDINNIHTLYENNTVEDNERGGIFHEISYEATIRNNILRRNGTGKEFPFWTTGAGIEVVSSRSVEVYGNTLVDNWQGITGLDDHRGTGNDGPWTLINFNVHDNDVTSRLTDSGGGRTGIVDTAGKGAFSTTANNHYHDNAYHLGKGAKYFIWTDGDCDETAWKAFGHDVTGTFQR